MKIIKRLLFRLIYNKELSELIEYKWQQLDGMEKSKNKKELMYYQGKKSATELIIYKLSGLNY